MNLRTQKATFPARLKTPDDRLLEVGKASISPENGTVDFQNEFVQLFKMDTIVKIVLLKDDVEIQSFTGKVYLSSQKLLRIVDVRDDVLVGAKSVCLFNVALNGHVRGTVESEHKRRFLFFRGPPSKEELFPVDVHRISMSEINFTSDKILKQGQFVHLSMETPQLQDVILEIDKGFEFGLTYNYHCQIKDLDAASRANLDAYVSELCRSQLTVFG